MRVLCTTTGSPSHGRAQLPLLRALAAAGHEVRVLTTSELTTVFGDDDVSVDPRLPAFDPSALVQDGDGAGPLGAQAPAEAQQARIRDLTRALGGPLARALYEVEAPAARAFRPDLVLRDGMDLGACLVAEELDVPQLPTPSGALNVLDPADLHEPLNAVRAALGLPRRDDPLSVVAHGRVDYVPAAFSFARHASGALAYQQTTGVTRAARLPDWFARLPTDRPLVWAALGSALPHIRRYLPADIGFPVPDPGESLRIILDATAELTDCTVVVGTSGILPDDIDPASLPAHITLTDWLPQPLVLETADLFLTHGGFNSVREALRTATPMAVLPHFGDQQPNAERVEELGLGRQIAERTPEAVAAACRAVLTDPEAGSTARRARLEMLALPPVEAAVDDLLKLTGAAR
ncbi:glycosyltransferase [Streptomyces sp. NPDC046887]|uniref:glycosyltransferase n=1 Tax=Streptomyces sp. NPDC046887 TaxID=3155472 RepID=UPI0033D50A84